MTAKPLYTVLLLSALSLAGCSLMPGASDSSATGKSITINGKKHYYDDKGNLVMSRKDYENYILTGAAKPPISTDPKRNMAVTAEELAVLMKDRSAFYAKLDGKNDEPNEVSVLMTAGTLKENLMRIAEELFYTSVEWQVTEEFEILKPFAVTGVHRRAVIVNIINDYPIKVFADEDNDRLVFTPSSIGYGQ